MNEITIVVKDDTVSLQGAGILDNQDEARELLQTALHALYYGDKKEEHQNEIVIEKPQ